MEPTFASNIKYIDDLEDKARSSRTSEEIHTILINDPGQSHLSFDNKIDRSSRCLNAFSETDLTNEFSSRRCRNYPRKEYKKLTWEQDSYEGNVVANNLHGSGFYFAQKGGQKYFYDGLFYMNKLEGYSQVFYENGTHFQGLFKSHMRYGPGVLSYPDGSQDVGFWDGFKLIRLACSVGTGTVPSLASTQAGKTKLLCSRYMIPLDEDNNDVLKELLTEIAEESKEFVPNLDVVFNPNIRNPNSLFFHRKFYDDQFFSGEDCMIKVFVEGDEAENVEEDEEHDKRRDDVPAERIRSLKSKIKEMHENLQTFIDIKYSLLQRINQCKMCCASASDIKTVSSESSSTKLTTRSLLEHSFDAPMDSFDVIKALADEDTTALTYPESSLNIISVCSCDEGEEFPGGLQHLEEQLKNIIVQETFYKNIRDELQNKLDRIVPAGTTPQNRYKFKLVKVNELWAWNNEKSAIQMQRHCFRHRNSEEMVNFSVPNLIAGNRKEFGPLGKHEETCHKFLIACAKGKKDYVKNCLQNNRVHPNIADAKGNSGIFFASAQNQNDIISILTNFGAKLDKMNDDQLTPLSLCFLKYIAVKNNCSNWERAFLPETQTSDQPDIPKWYNIKSFLSISSTSTPELQSINSACKQYSARRFSNLRIMDLFQRASVCVDHKKLSLPKSLQNTNYIFDLRSQNPTGRQDDEELDYEVETELKYIYLTIITLLDYGANPNLIEVPYPALVLSLFTENADLVKEVIKANIDINVVIDLNLSCLHIAASLTPTDDNAYICHVLTKYGCNPNLKTSPNHWEDKRSYFTGKLPENVQIDDKGKNALHLLCMRSDFQNSESGYFCTVAKVLLETNLDTKDTYLGHTALSLAVLSGNINLVQCLIESNIFNPYQPMEYGMGNILTLFALKRFDNTLSIDQRKAMLTALFEMDVNVLNKVYDTENAIVFAEDKDNFFDEFIQKEVKEPKKGGTKAKAKAANKKLEKHSPAVAAKELLRNLGRQTITKQIQFIITEMLFDIVEEEECLLQKHEITEVLASEYLTTSVVLKNLKYLFQNRRIGHDRLEQTTVKKLLEFVNSHKKIVKKVTSKKLMDKTTSEQTHVAQEDLEAMVKELDTPVFQAISREYLTIPGLDDPSKYQVCFHCLRGKEKLLKICPRCQMVHFCSLQCNKLNLKLKTQHGCNILFYDMTDEQIVEISKGLCLKGLFDNIKGKCIVRWRKIRETKLAQEEKKLFEMWKTDVYGTKFLQIKPRLDRAVTKRRDKQLHWNLGLLKGILERNFQKSPGDTSLYSLENLLFKLQGKKRSEGTIRTRHSCSTRRSTLGGSTLHSVIFNLYDKVVLNAETSEAAPGCRCPKKVHGTKSKQTGKQKKKAETGRRFQHNMTDERSEHFEEIVGDYTVRDRPQPAIKKLKKIPERYHKFIEVIGTYFPDTDLSFWLLPYACYSGGQLYYKFCDNNLFKESYSFS